MTVAEGERRRNRKDRKERKGGQMEGKKVQKATDCHLSLPKNYSAE